MVDLLTTRGWHVYSYTQDAAHPIDLIAITPERNIVLVEVKCKSARDYYPDTGVDFDDHNRYHELSMRTNLPILVLFVDPRYQSVYGQYLHILSQPTVVLHNGRELVYPMVVEQRYVFYPLCAMEHYANIPPAVLQELTRFEHSRYVKPLPKRTSTTHSTPLDKSVADEVYYEYGWLDVPTAEPND